MKFSLMNEQIVEFQAQVATVVAHPVRPSDSQSIVHQGHSYF
jgi:hypothetical protein